MTTLAALNDTIIKQTQVLDQAQVETSERLEVLIKSFDKAFKPRFKGDTIEEKYEKRGGAATAAKERSDSDGKGRFFDFDVGNLLPFAATFMSGLLKRGLPAILGAILADEIGEGIKKLTGSDVMGKVAEYASLGGALGFLLGGVKGGLLGAALGVLFSEPVRDKIAKVLSEITGKEIDKMSPEVLATAAMGGLTAYVLTKNLIGALAPLMGAKGVLMLGLAGALGYGTVKLAEYLKNRSQEITDKAIREAQEVDLTNLEDIERNQKVLGAVTSEARRAAEISNTVDPALLKAAEDAQRGLNRLHKEKGLNTAMMKKFDIADAIDRDKQGILDYAYSEALRSAAAQGKEVDQSDFRKSLFNVMGELQKDNSGEAAALIAFTTNIRDRLQDLEGMHERFSGKVTAGKQSARADIANQLRNLRENPDLLRAEGFDAEALATENKINRLEQELIRTTPQSANNLSSASQTDAVRTLQNINAVDNSVTNNTESPTVMVGQGSSTLDANDPKFSRMSLSGL